MSALPSRSALITGAVGTAVLEHRDSTWSRKNGVDTFHFFGGCANAPSTPAPQDPLQWSQVRLSLLDPAVAFPPAATGDKIVSIEIVFDEGTDTANNETQGIGLAFVDNIYINGKVITSGSRGRGGDKGGDKNVKGDNGGNGDNGDNGSDD